MKPSGLDIKYVARLARIELTPEEESLLGLQLAGIMAYVEKLKEADIRGVEATAHPYPMVNITRPDEISQSLTSEEALANAPAKANGLFRVPKIVE